MRIYWVRLGLKFSSLPLLFPRTHVMQLDDKTDQLRPREEKPDFWTQHSISNHDSLFSMLYGTREPCYRKLRELLNAVVPLTVTWLGSDGLTRTLSLSYCMLKRKEVNSGYGIFVQPKIILTTSFLFELPVNFRLGAVSYNDEECELLDMPESLPSTAPEMRRIRYLRTQYPHPHIDEVGYGFPGKRDVFPWLSSF